MVNSKQKGSRVERELANLLKSMGHTARRSQQYAGRVSDSADIVCETLPDWHFECKGTAVKTLTPGMLTAWYTQVKKDTDKEKWCIAIKANGYPWCFAVPAAIYNSIMFRAQHEHFTLPGNLTPWADFAVLEKYFEYPYIIAKSFAPSMPETIYFLTEESFAIEFSNDV